MARAHPQAGGTPGSLCTIAEFAMGPYRPRRASPSLLAVPMPQYVTLVLLGRFAGFPEELEALAARDALPSLAPTRRMACQWLLRTRHSQFCTALRACARYCRVEMERSSEFPPTPPLELPRGLALNSFRLLCPGTHQVARLPRPASREARRNLERSLGHPVFLTEDFAYTAADVSTPDSIRLDLECDFERRLHLFDLRRLRLRVVEEDSARPAASAE